MIRWRNSRWIGVEIDTRPLALLNDMLLQDDRLESLCFRPTVISSVIPVIEHGHLRSQLISGCLTERLQKMTDILHFIRIHAAQELGI